MSGTKWHSGISRCGDPVGFAEGHVTRDECVAAALSAGEDLGDYIDQGCGPIRERIWHGYITFAPNEGEEGDGNVTWLTEPDDRDGKAMPVTFWDMAECWPRPEGWSDVARTQEHQSREQGGGS